MPDNTTPTHEPTQRLNKFVALALGVSRRQADELIEQGTVTVNDQPAQLGQRITTADIIRYDNKPLTAQTHQLILLHKPVGYLCSRASQGGVPTIYELLPKDLHHLKPVGRLDKDSSGLILLTNDGDFAAKIEHPSAQIEKEYVIETAQDFPPELLTRFERGIRVDGIFYKCRSAAAVNRRKLRIVLVEGKNREIRRVLDSFNCTIKRLVRVRIGNLELGTLKAGEFRDLTANERHALLDLIHN